VGVYSVKDAHEDALAEIARGEGAHGPDAPAQRRFIGFIDTGSAWLARIFPALTWREFRSTEGFGTAEECDRIRTIARHASPS
jgi:hypothetical protein